jgi:chromosome segregation ATPase
MKHLFGYLPPFRTQIAQEQEKILELQKRIKALEKQVIKLNEDNKKIQKENENYTKKIQSEHNLLKEAVAPLTAINFPLEDVNVLLNALLELLKNDSTDKKKCLGKPIRFSPVIIMKLANQLVKNDDKILHGEIKYETLDKLLRKNEALKKELNTLKNEANSLKKELRYTNNIDLQDVAHWISNLKNTEPKNPFLSSLDKSRFNDWPGSSHHDSGESCSSPL